MTPAVVARPIWVSVKSVNQIAPSGPVTRRPGPVPAPAYSVIVPSAGLIAPSLPAAFSLNQKRPSEPSVMASGWLPEVGMGYSVMSPCAVILPTLLPAVSTNHMLPSDAPAIPLGLEPAVGISNVSTVPSTLSRPI